MVVSRLLAAVVFMLACGRPAFALDTALDVTQYVHTAWKNSEGFGQARITAIAQTPDG